MSLETFGASKSCLLHVGPLKDGRILPCQHWFCFECLKPYSTSRRVVCPVCRAMCKTDIYLLPSVNGHTPLAQVLLDALPRGADEHLIKNKVSATEERVRAAEDACESSIELLESMKAHFVEIKNCLAQKRLQLLTDAKRHAEDLAGDKANSTESAKELLTICDMLQRLCAMTSHKTVHQVLSLSKDLEDTIEQLQQVGVCRYDVESEAEPLTDAEETRVVKCLAEQLQTYRHRPRPEKLAESLAQSLSQLLRFNGCCTSIVGYTKLDWSGPRFRLIRATVDNVQLLILFCRSTPDIGQLDNVQPTSERVDSLLEEALRSGHQKKAAVAEKQDSSINQDLELIRQRFTAQFGGNWHCCRSKNNFVVKHSTSKQFQFVVQRGDDQYQFWKN